MLIVAAAPVADDQVLVPFAVEALARHRADSAKSFVPHRGPEIVARVLLRPAQSGERVRQQAGFTGSAAAAMQPANRHAFQLLEVRRRNEGRTCSASME